MSVIQLSTLKEVATISTGEGPHELTVSADGKLAFVANYGGQKHGHSLSVINIIAQKEIRRVELGPLYRPHGIEEKNGKVYFISELTRTVGRYDFAEDKIDWITGTGQDGGHMLVLTPDGKRIYTANRLSHTVSSIDMEISAGPGVITQLTTGSRPEGITVAPDGKELWVGNTGDGTISIIDVLTNTVKQNFQVGKVPIRIKFTPDGKKALVSDNAAGELVVIDAVTRNVIKRISTGSSPVGICIAPDGKQAFIACSGSNVVQIVDLKTLNIIESINTGNNPDGLAWVR